MDALKVAEVVNGELLGIPLEVKGFHFDSRLIREGEFFIPLKGSRDGHLFIEEAFKKGAVGALTEKSLTPPKGKFLVKVDDALLAFKRIASYKRSLFKGKVVGITGSVGKSTTKELLYHAVSPFLKAYRNQKSFNNEIGVSHTLSNLPLDSFLLLQELGTNSPGEIPRLRELVRPDYGVITTVSPAHMEGFKTFKALLKEKLSITEGVELSILPHSLSNLSASPETITFGKEGAVKLVELKDSFFGTEFKVKAFGKEFSFKTSVPGLAVVNATLIAVALFYALNLPLNELPPLVSTFTPPSGRLKVEKLNGLYLIDDSYNANPASFENALKVLSLFKGKKVAVVGQMLELGEVSEAEHERLGELLNVLGIDALIAFGRETLPSFNAFSGEKYYFSDRDSLISFVKEYPFKGAVLVKGSRGNRLEEVSRIIRERFGS
ncbi:UDP-N-acetylmuramoyl-tripeptide--D-alanyl-D-alanine ligase [Thermovibrio sp.]